MGRSRRSRFRLRVVRRLLAAGLAAGAVWGGLAAVREPTPEPAVAVLVAVRDLAVGTRLAPDDVRVRIVPAEVAAWGAVAAPRDVSVIAGRVLAAPLGAGEILTERRLHASTWLAGAPAGTVAVAVPVHTTGLLEMLRPGDRVRVFAPGTGAEVASGVVLIARSVDGVLVAGPFGVGSGSGASAGPSSGSDSAGVGGAGGAQPGGGWSGEAGGSLGALGSERPPLLVLAVPEAQATAIAAALAPEASSGFVLALTSG